MPDPGAKTYFVITLKGDRGPLDRSEVVELVRSGEVRHEDRVRNAFGRPLGTVAEILGTRPTANRISSSRPTPPERRARTTSAPRSRISDHLEVEGDEQPLATASAGQTRATAERRRLAPILVMVGVLVMMALVGVVMAFVGSGSTPPAQPQAPSQPTRPEHPLPQPTQTQTPQPAPVQPPPPAPVHAQPVAGGAGLQASVAPANGTFDLAAAGSLDWQHPADGSRSALTAKVLAIEGFGGGPVAFDGAVVGCSWHDGAPVARGLNVTTGWYISGDGAGFAITAPAGTGESTLRLRLGSWNAAGELQMSLSDDSSPAQSIPAPFSANQRYLDVTVIFHAAANGQSLRVRWLQRGADGNVTILGAALAGTATAAAPAPPPPAPAAPDMPQGWSVADIGGGPAAPPPASTGDNWRVSGAGADIWNDHDQFRFLSTTLPADGTVSVHLLSCDGRHSQAKTGVMLRASTDPGAPFVLLSVSPTGNAECLFRPEPGRATDTLPNVPRAGYPTWIRLVRHGAVITSWMSGDGRTWREAAPALTIPALRGPSLAGLAVCSHEAAPMTVSCEKLAVTPAP